MISGFYWTSEKHAVSLFSKLQDGTFSFLRWEVMMLMNWSISLWVTDHQKVSLYFVENTDTDERKDRTKEDYVSFSQQLSTWRYSTDLTIGIFPAHSDIISSSSKLYEPLRLLFSVPKAVHLWCHYWTLSFLRCSMPPMMIDKHLFLLEAFILL